MTFDLLTHYMRHASSFAATWLSCWFVLYLVIWLVYPGVRRFIAGLHPATASSTVLALMALPFVTSLVATSLVFSPLLEQNWITTHYHSADCESRLPLLRNGVAIAGVLGATGLALTAMLIRFCSQLFYSLKLEAKLALLSEKKGQWYLLPHKERLVFTMGWLRNSIFITEGLLAQCESRDADIILEHEKAHARRKDNLRILASKVLMLIVPSFMKKRFTEDLQLYTEAACDFSTAQKHGALNVAQTLVRIERLTPRCFSFFNKAMMSAFNGSVIEERVHLLLEGKPTEKAGRFRPVLYAVGMLALAILLVDPIHHAVEWLLD
jgi:beta-lactamase regulating signal transducer with metallopeptidase domain